MKTKIEYVKNKLKYGFIGMNSEAAKAHHIPFKHKSPKHTIVVYNRVPKNVRVTTIRHEEAESYLMRVKHMRYKKAHEIALRYEKLDKPFKIKLLREMLKRK